MNNSKNNLKTLSSVDLNKINGGGKDSVFAKIGEAIGTGLAYYCKGASAIKG
ncbi:lactococcin G-alpha/enterocin 1071A family bacteriocin [Clostridium sp. L74]|uniref:lactococcin G-alpha/enterocin 1071A family bacteriocin n=1 Tax=Clostridium sp. L74 TaxID=1560217 RepID=UPI0006C51E6A|nr:lactococcin G-alpha/enterocin 1071A family bacteriocin [Clostridium sp. L74]KOR25290.1 hypothetical protein ND00_18390 [Clostridium sp. L74]